MQHYAIAITALATWASATLLKVETGAGQVERTFSDFVGCWATKSKPSLFGGSEFCIEKDGYWFVDGKDYDGFSRWRPNRDNVLLERNQKYG